MSDECQRTSNWPVGLLVAVVLVPVVAYLLVPRIPRGVTAARAELYSGGSAFTEAGPGFRQQVLLPGKKPRITNVQVVDLDGDGVNEVLACDALGHRLLRIVREKNGDWRTETLAEELLAPAHATVVDLDGDGDRDLVVSLLGNIQPDDGVIGRVVWLERDGEVYRRHVILDDVRRVADAQAGDLDGDGDIDLAVAVFGYARGAVMWLENNGNEQFIEHTLLSSPGAIHVPLADFDGDGDLDIVTGVSQDEEEVWGFVNDGRGQFEPRRLWYTTNYDLGSAGLVAADLDQDGDQDLLLPAGDNFEYRYTYPQPYHGCLWFENLGNWEFQQHRVGHFGGTYAAAVGDPDGDGDHDVVLVSMFNDWYRGGRTSVAWFRNEGHQQFQPLQVADSPTHLATVACGDLDGDGIDDIVAGSLHVTPPFDRAAAIVVFLSSMRASR